MRVVPASAASPMAPSSPRKSPVPRASLRASFRTWPGSKIALMLGLTLGICGPYFLLQRVELFPRWQVPVLAIDRAIPFLPGWTPVYLSVCALVPLSILAARRRADLVAFGQALAGLCAVHYVGFLLLPSVGPRPHLDEVAALSRSYAWLVSVDGARNAFPSLHAALTVFCMGFALRVAGTGAGIGLRTAGFAWGGAILFATLATRQHYFLDILAGALLGGIAHAGAARLAHRARG